MNPVAAALVKNIARHTSSEPIANSTVALSYDHFTTSGGHRTPSSARAWKLGGGNSCGC